MDVSAAGAWSARVNGLDCVYIRQTRPSVTHQTVVYSRHCYMPHDLVLHEQLNVHGKKGSPYSIAERMVLELIPVLGSQSGCDV